MQLLRNLCTAFVALLCVSIVQASDEDHGPRVFPRLLFPGQNVPSGIVHNNGTFIVVRYLGYECSHCVRQLTYINTHAAELRAMAIEVIAISADPESRWNALVKKMELDRSLFHYVADVEGQLSTSLGAIRTINDTLQDMHATLVIRDGRVVFSVYSDQPYMDIDRVVSFAEPQVLPVVTTPNYLDRYTTQTSTIKIIASASDGLKEPLDLDFNRSVLHTNDLWVVTAERNGHAMTIVHNAGTPQQVIRQKKDSRASHFMWRTMSLAMGTNGALGTAQNGEPGGPPPTPDKLYMFMGPSLWSSDTAVFASRYQTDNNRLASHLDMLHQSPWGLGIVHDTANVFWVLDARYKSVSRYDFRDPHEVGGTDHRDGIIRRYIEASIVPVERGRPAHMALDKRTGLLYYIDPLLSAIHTLDTRSGAFSNNLVAPYESEENYTEFSAYTDATVSTVITDGLTEPVGMDIVGDRLIVGDRKDGRIHIYAIEGATVRELGNVATGAAALHGIAVGPDGRIWFVDKDRAVVGRLDLSLESKLVAETPARVVQKTDQVRFVYTNGETTSRTASFSYVVRRQRDPLGASVPQLTSLRVDAGATTDLIIPVTVTDSLTAWVLDVEEVLSDGSSTVPVSTILVPYNVRRALVQDERVGTFDIQQALDQTSRVGYVSLTSDVFNVVADSLHVLKTVLWNSGSFGEIDVVDDAIIQSVLKRKIEMFLIADDPLILRTDLPNSIGFFAGFGCSLRGVDGMENDAGQRIFKGVLADPVTAGMSAIDIQLPRLDHGRGGKYVPNVTFRLSKPGSIAMMRRANDTIIGAVRYQSPTYRSIILGVHAARFVDGAQRTTILDKGLVWLEAFADPDSVPTDVQDENLSSASELIINVGANPVVVTTTWNVTGPAERVIQIELYSVVGQRMASMYEGPTSGASGVLDVSSLPTGSYFIVARASDAVAHRTIIVR